MQDLMGVSCIVKNMSLAIFRQISRFAKVLPLYSTSFTFRTRALFLSSGVALAGLTGMALVGAAFAQHSAFVTSTSGSADLNSWTDAGGLEGLAAADRICSQRAQSANLTGTFVAALSDETDDAFCRLHGLTGKRADNCGMDVLPNDAGPWVRVDGYPLGDSLAAMIDGRMWVPVQLNENGEQVTFDHWTGSFARGNVSAGETCEGWTSASTSLFGGKGDSYGTKDIWLSGGSSRCDQDLHLLCLESGPGAPVAIPYAEGALVFYERQNYAADFGSLEAADAICKQAAAEAELPVPESFKAWLSDSNTNAIDRFTWDGPWKRLDGVPVAQNKADLTDGILFAPINLTEDGLYTALQGGVWTSTNFDGTRTASNCQDWTSTSQDETSERLRTMATTDAGWTVFSNGIEDLTWRCSVEVGFYCFAQVAIEGIIFADDFESQN